MSTSFWTLKEIQFSALFIFSRGLLGVVAIGVVAWERRNNMGKTLNDWGKRFAEHMTYKESMDETDDNFQDFKGIVYSLLMWYTAMKLPLWPLQHILLASQQTELNCLQFPKNFTLKLNWYLIHETMCVFPDCFCRWRLWIALGRGMHFTETYARELTQKIKVKHYEYSKINYPWKHLWSLHWVKI